MYELPQDLMSLVSLVIALAALLVSRNAYVLQRARDEEERKRRKSPLEKGMIVLLGAYEHTQNEGKDPWYFAVDAVELRDLGLNNSDFRLLLDKGYVEDAEAQTRLGCSGRSFRRLHDETFTRNICFILTGKGVEYARNMLKEQMQANLKVDS